MTEAAFPFSQLAWVFWLGGLWLASAHIGMTVVAARLSNLKVSEVKLGLGPTKSVTLWGIEWRVQPLLPLSSSVRFEGVESFSDWRPGQLHFVGFLPWVLLLGLSMAAVGWAPAVDELKSFATAVIDFGNMRERLAAWLSWSREQSTGVWLSSFTLRLAAFNLLPLAPLGGAVPVRWAIHRVFGETALTRYSAVTLFGVLAWMLTALVSLFF